MRLIWPFKSLAFRFVLWPSVGHFFPNETDLLPQQFVRLQVHRATAFVQEILHILETAEYFVVAFLVALLEQTGAIDDHHNIVAQEGPARIRVDRNFAIYPRVVVVALPQNV